MDISKSYTKDTYDVERQERINESLERIKKGKKEKKVELTQREKVIEMVQGMYFKNIKRRELTEFFEDMADYIIKNGIILK